MLDKVIRICCIRQIVLTIVMVSFFSKFSKGYLLVFIISPYEIKTANLQQSYLNVCLTVELILSIL